jgi:hypothetical protein
MASSSSTTSSSITSSSTIYTYYIQSHGGIVRLQNAATENKIQFIALTIPEGVEIFTYTDLGEFHFASCTTVNYVCEKHVEELYSFQTPHDKYKNKFPEIEFHPDNPNPLNKTPRFYSNIVHCIPETRQNSRKTKEIIHNMDADPEKDCSDNSISERPYYSTNRYSEDYVKVLEKKNGNFRDFPLNKIKKCGPLFLSEAIKIIMQHCHETYKEDYSKSIIQIHIMACLKEIEEPLDKHKEDALLVSELVSDLQYFEDFKSTDSQIKDTPHFKTYSYKHGTLKFMISVPKQHPIDYNFNDIDNVNMYQKSIEDAFNKYKGGAIGFFLEEKIKRLPKEIIINISKPQTVSLKSKTEITNIIYDKLKKIEKEATAALFAEANSELDREEEEERSKMEAQEDSKLPLKGGKKRLIKSKKMRLQSKRFIKRRQRTQRRQRKQRTQRRQRKQRKQRHKRTQTHKKVITKNF